MWDSWYNYVTVTRNVAAYIYMRCSRRSFQLRNFVLPDWTPLGLWSVERCHSNHVMFHSTFGYEGSYQYWVVLEWFQLKNSSSLVPHIMDPPTQFQVPFLKKQIPIPGPQWTSTHQCTIHKCLKCTLLNPGKNLRIWLKTISDIKYHCEHGENSVCLGA